MSKPEEKLNLVEKEVVSEKSNASRFGSYAKDIGVGLLDTAAQTIQNPIKGLASAAKLIETSVGRPISFAIEKIAGKEAAEKAQQGWDKLKNTVSESKVGKVVSKAYEVATNSMVGKIVGGVVGITAAVALGPILIGVAAVGVSVKVVKQIATTRENRQLRQEHKAINEHKACNEIQAELKTKFPELKALENQLKPKDLINPKKLHAGLNKLHDVPTKAEIVQGIAVNVVKDTAKEKIVDAVKEAITEVASDPSPIGVVKATLKGVIVTANESREAYEKAEKTNDIKREINEAKRTPLKDKIPPYESLPELKESARDKKINTAALIELTKDTKKYDQIKGDPEAIKKEFNKLKEEISKTMPTAEKEGIVSVLKDVGRTLPITSKYSKNEVEFTSKDEIKKDFQENGIKGEPRLFERIKSAMNKAASAIKNVFSSKNKDEKPAPAQETKTETTISSSKSTESLVKKNKTQEHTKEVVEKVSAMRNSTPVHEHNSTAPEATRPRSNTQDIKKSNSR